MIADTSCPLCKDNFASYQSMIRHVGRKHPTEDISNIQKKFVACSTVGFYLFFLVFVDCSCIQFNSWSFCLVIFLVDCSCKAFFIVRRCSMILIMFSESGCVWKIEGTASKMKKKVYSRKFCNFYSLKFYYASKSKECLEGKSRCDINEKFLKPAPA